MARKKWLILTILLSVVAAGISGGTHPVSAQTRSDPLSLVMACSETDFTKVTADSLHMTVSELHLALVSGKTVKDLADAKKLTLQSVLDSYFAALDKAIAPALEDGLINQQQANIIRSQARYTTNGQLAGLNVPADNFGIVTSLYTQPNLWGGLTLYNYNAVKPLLIVAKMLDLKCSALVKLAQPNKSVILFAAEKKIQIQGLIDALVKAYTEALDQDVKDKLLTEAQADGQKVRLLERVVTQLSQPGFLVPRLLATPVNVPPTPLPPLPALGTPAPTPLATAAATQAK